jgi:hypothetical protein
MLSNAMSLRRLVCVRCACLQIMGEDREYPILRLQPKIKFDIDLQ